MIRIETLEPTITGVGGLPGSTNEVRLPQLLSFVV
jgi:hypothetical protein